MAITNQQELDAALEAVAQFHERVPQFSGSELDASLMLERLHKTGREVTPDALEQTYYELHGGGLLDLLDNPADDLMTSGPGIRNYEPPQPTPVESAPLTDSTDDQYDDYEIELDEGVKPEDITVDGLIGSLPSSDIRGMIEAAEGTNAPRQASVWDDVDSLSTTELAILVSKLEKQ